MEGCGLHSAKPSQHSPAWLDAGPGPHLLISLLHNHSQVDQGCSPSSGSWLPKGQCTAVASSPPRLLSKGPLLAMAATARHLPARAPRPQRCLRAVSVDGDRNEKAPSLPLPRRPVSVPKRDLPRERAVTARNSHDAQQLSRGPTTLRCRLPRSRKRATRAPLPPLDALQDSRNDKKRQACNVE
jgi:hypothetical protein